MASNDPATESVAPTVSTENPPQSIPGILRRLGPGLIIAASIVGSGELIGTTKTGADAGYALLWLIIIGCIIKVFMQVELGRFTIVEGRTSMDAMNLVEPRWGVSWVVWYWLLMFIASLGQLGGICGGVGQSLAMTFPIRGDYLEHLEKGTTLPEIGSFSDLFSSQMLRVLGCDDVIWSIVVAVATSILLVVGRYKLIETVSTILVAGFTLVTVFDVAAIPSFGNVQFSWADISYGLSFHLPEGQHAMATALATFGIIGVGANELIAYPYWCLEKGYARNVGRRDDSAAWAARANGWLRVMRWDAWCSMIIYTFATLAFYLLGAGILHARKMSPDNTQMVPILAEMYKDVFDPWGEYIFLVGAFAVLYSTFFVAIAGHTRIVADALKAWHLGAKTAETRDWWIKFFCLTFPIIGLMFFIVWRKPVDLVLNSGLMQAIMLPMLGGMAVWFRYTRCDPRVAPGRAWDAALWLSLVGVSITAVWAAYAHIVQPLMRYFTAASN